MSSGVMTKPQLLIVCAAMAAASATSFTPAVPSAAGATLIENKARG